LITLRGDILNFNIVESNCIDGVAAHEKCYVTVSLEGTLPGSYQTDLNLSNPVLAASAHLTGKGSEAQIGSTSPATGNAYPGKTNQLVIDVVNGGGATTGALATVVSGTLSVVDTCKGHTLAGGESCQMTALLAVPLDGSGGGMAHVEVSGTPGGTLTRD